MPISNEHPDQLSGSSPGKTVQTPLALPSGGICTFVENNVWNQADARCPQEPLPVTHPCPTLSCSRCLASQTYEAHIRAVRTCTPSLRRWALQASEALAMGPNHLHDLQRGGRPPSRTPSEAAAANGQHSPCGLAVCWVWGFSRNQDSQVFPHGGYAFLPPGPSLARQVRNLQLSRGNIPNG